MMRILSFALLALTLLPVPAIAGLLDVSSPSVKEGVASVEYWTAYERTPDVYAHALEASYGVTSFWKTTIEGTAERTGGDKMDYVATSWKNTLRFWQQTADMPVAIGMRLDYERAHVSGDNDAIKARVLLQHKTGPYEARLNIGGSKEVGDNAAQGIDGDVRASLRYAFMDGYKIGVDYLGDTGTLHDMPAFDQQQHHIGPVLWGSLAPNLGFEVGYLAGITDGTSDHAFKLGLEYSF